MRVPCCLGGVAAILFPAEPASASQFVQRFYQDETRDYYGRLTREAATIYVLLCNGYGESGRSYYIYQYMRRPGFRVIVPPYWGSAIGGRDWGSWAEAVSVASCAAQTYQPPNLSQYPTYSPPAPAPAPAPAAQPGGLTGRWYAGTTLYDMVQSGGAFTWSAFGGQEIGQGTIVGDDLQVTWTGGGTATGKVTQRSATGAPTQIGWNNGVVFNRGN